jgi:hypothetical protein
MPSQQQSPCRPYIARAVSDVQPQNLSNVLLACATLHKQPAAEELQLQLLVQRMLRPRVLQAATTQSLANRVWALSTLQQLPSWRGGVSEEQLQQLLGEQQVQRLAMEDTPQGTSNVLLSLACMASGSKPLLSKAFAEAAAQHLLDAAVQRKLRDWIAQTITNAMWACGQLQLTDSTFMSAVVAAAPKWLPVATPVELSQALIACGQLQMHNTSFLQQLLQRSLQICQQQQQQQRNSTPTEQAQRGIASLVGWCGWAVAQLDMQQLAGAARDVVAASGVKQQPNTHPSNLRRLWVFHSWLLQHQLLDGKGLAGLLTEQQLQQGSKEAAEHGRDKDAMAALGC